MKKPSPSTLAKWTKVWHDHHAKHRMCAMCMVNPAAEIHHLVPKRHLATRWHPLNGLALCHACHQESEHGPHKDFRSFNDTWLKANRPVQHQFFWDHAYKIEQPDWAAIKAMVEGMK